MFEEWFPLIEQSLASWPRTTPVPLIQLPLPSLNFQFPSLRIQNTKNAKKGSDGSGWNRLFLVIYCMWIGIRPFCFIFHPMNSTTFRELSRTTSTWNYRNSATNWAHQTHLFLSEIPSLSPQLLSLSYRRTAHVRPHTFVHQPVYRPSHPSHPSGISLSYSGACR